MKKISVGLIRINAYLRKKDKALSRCIGFTVNIANLILRSLKTVSLLLLSLIFIYMRFPPRVATHFYQTD